MGAASDRGQPWAGTPPGSSWARNNEQRSASSASPMRPAVAEAAQRPQEAAVRLGVPPHVSAPPPPVGPQAVQPAVVPDPVAGVGLDVVPGQVAEPRPGVEVPRPAGHDVGHRVPALCPRAGQCARQLLPAPRRLDIEHGGRWAAGGEVDGASVSAV